MKKKYRDGISTFEALLTLPSFAADNRGHKGRLARERYAFLAPLIHLYKAFGELCENRIDAADMEYNKYDALCK